MPSKTLPAIFAACLLLTPAFAGPEEDARIQSLERRIESLETLIRGMQPVQPVTAATPSGPAAAPALSPQAE